MRKLQWALMLALLPALGWAQVQWKPVPLALGLQGRLLSKDGTPLLGTQQITFAIYPSAEGGSAVWSETQTLALTNGFYATFLGGGKTALDTTKLDGSDLYVGITVAGTELKPRQKIGSVAYALLATQAVEAEHADEATTVRSGGSVSTGSVSASSVTVSGSASAGGNIHSNGNIDASGTVSGNALSASTITSNGNVVATGDLVAGSGGRITSAGAISGSNLTVGSATVTNELSAGSVSVSGNVSVSGRLKGRVVGSTEGLGPRCDGSGNLICNTSWGGVTCGAGKCPYNCSTNQGCRYEVPTAYPIICPAGSSLHMGFCIDDG